MGGHGGSPVSGCSGVSGRRRAGPVGEHQAVRERIEIKPVAQMRVGGREEGPLGMAHQLVLEHGEGGEGDDDQGRDGDLRHTAVHAPGRHSGRDRKVHRRLQGEVEHGDAGSRHGGAGEQEGIGTLVDGVGDEVHEAHQQDAAKRKTRRVGRGCDAE